MTVTERCEIRNHPDVPEHERDRKIGTDRKDVPEKCGSEIDPEGAAGVGIGKDPKSEPRSAHMDNRENPGTHDGKNSHRLRRAIDRRPPLLTEKKKNGRDQGPRMTDINPEHEVRNVKSTPHRLVQAPDTDAGLDLIGDHDRTDRQDGNGKTKTGPPGLAGTRLQRPTNFLGHLTDRDMTGDQWFLEQPLTHRRHYPFPSSLFLIFVRYPTTGRTPRSSRT